MSRDLQALATGLAAGFIGGLFGVGGGVLMVPVLVLGLGLAPRRAVATSLVAIVAAATAGGVRFGLEGEVDATAALYLFAGSGIGAVAGTRLVGRISDVWLARGFVVVAFAAALRLGFGS